MLINNIQTEILEHLGYFAYLTVSQLARLTGKSLSYLREQLAILTHRKYIRSYHVEVATRVRAENMYFLTKDGSTVLLDNNKIFTEIRVPVSTPLFVRDYFHRKHYTDLLISIVQEFRKRDVTISLLYSYFDKTISNKKDAVLRGKTSIPVGNTFFMPDGILITEQNTTRTLYLLELHNGKDTQRALQHTIASHALAIAQGSPGKTFGISANPFVLCAFEYEGCKQAVIKRLQQNERFLPLQQFFYFASLDDVIKDCANVWHTIADDPLVFR